MKMQNIRKKTFFALLFLLIGAFSCEMIVDIDVPFEGNQLVPLSFIDPHRPFEVKVVRSRYILERDPNWYGHNPYDPNPQEEPFIIKNANVSVYEGEELVDVLSYTENGIYKSASIKPVVGKKYTVKINAQGYPQAEASDYVPERVQILSAVIKKEVSRDQWDMDNYFSVTLRFKDPGKMENFYMFNMYGEADIEYEGEIHKQKFGSSFESFDPSIVGPEYGYSAGSNGISFTDALFDGKEYEIKFFFRRWYNSENKQTYYFYLYNLSKAAHLYNLSSKMQGDDWGNPFAQPVQIFSNVSHGKGIFGGINYDVFELQIEE
jgi:hypothetical protein